MNKPDNSRKVNIGPNTRLEGANVNLGDFATQSASHTTTVIEAATTSLLEAIRAHPDLTDSERVDAVSTVEEISKGVQNGSLRSSLAAKLYGTLPVVIQGLEVAQRFLHLIGH